MMPFAAAPCAAANQEDCEGLARVGTIQHTVQPEYPLEITKYGKLVQGEERFPELGPGPFVYLIFENEDVAFGPKYDVHQFISHGRGVITHKSLINFMRDLVPDSQPERQVIGAGEFHMGFDAASVISNRSGNFRGTEYTLPRSVQILNKRGLPINELTTLRAYDPRQNEHGHTPVGMTFDQWQLEMLTSLHNHPRGYKLMGIYSKFAALLKESMPNLTTKEALLKLVTLRMQGARITGNQRGSFLFLMPMSAAYSIDGLVYGIAAVIGHEQELDPREFIPEQLQNVAIGAGKLSDELSDKWNQLIEEARKL